MKVQEGGCGVAATSRDFAGVRSLGDAEEKADHQMAPEQAGELLGKFGRTACEQSGRLGPGHDFTQGSAACLASYREIQLGLRSSRYLEVRHINPYRLNVNT
jgi:hypothetical protein